VVGDVRHNIAVVYVLLVVYRTVCRHRQRKKPLGSRVGHYRVLHGVPLLLPRIVFPLLFLLFWPSWWAFDSVNNHFLIFGKQSKELIHGRDFPFGEVVALAKCCFQDWLLPSVCRRPAPTARWRLTVGCILRCRSSAANCWCILGTNWFTLWIPVFAGITASVLAQTNFIGV